jgi:hypothetical protein
VVLLTGVVSTVHDSADRESQRHSELGSNRTSASCRKTQSGFQENVGKTKTLLRIPLTRINAKDYEPTN